MSVAGVMIAASGMSQATAAISASSGLASQTLGENISMMEVRRLASASTVLNVHRLSGTVCQKICQYVAPMAITRVARTKKAKALPIAKFCC